MKTQTIMKLKKTSDIDKLNMILSKNIDISALGKGCISVDKFNSLAKDLILWRGVCKCCGDIVADVCDKCVDDIRQETASEILSNI